MAVAIRPRPGGLLGDRPRRLRVLERRDAAGALGGEALSDPSAFGLDAAAPAAFLALLAPRLTGRSAQATALAAAAAALIAGPLTPAGVPVLVAALGGAAVMWPAILLAAGGCYLLKLAGLSVPGACSRRRASSASPTASRSHYSPP